MLFSDVTVSNLVKLPIRTRKGRDCRVLVVAAPKAHAERMCMGVFRSYFDFAMYIMEHVILLKEISMRLNNPAFHIGEASVF